MAEQGRYGKLSEEEAATQFELRHQPYSINQQLKQQILGNLQEQYQNANSQKNKKQSKSQQQQSNKQEFIVFNPTKKPSSKPSKNPSKQLQFLKEESSVYNQSTPPQEQEIEYQVQNTQNDLFYQNLIVLIYYLLFFLLVQKQYFNNSNCNLLNQPTPPEQSPFIDKPQKPSINQMLLRDIGNLDLEIQRLTRQTKDFQSEKFKQISIIVTIKNSQGINPKTNLIPNQSQQQQTKAYYELRQRPSSKESRISDASYTKKAECFKGVIRSSSLKKLPQSQNQNTNYNFLQLRSSSEKRINQSMNKTNTIESENKDITQKIVQSERKIPKPMIQINISQSKQDTPTYEKKSKAPVKSIMKVQFNSIPVECSSTKNNSCSYFHQHKESYNSQISFSKNKCVEAQIEEAVLIIQQSQIFNVKQNKCFISQKRWKSNTKKNCRFF